MINPRIQNVTPTNDYQLIIKFTNGEERIFDMKSFLDKGVFKALQDLALFTKAHIAWGTVVWNEDIDMSPDTLYLDSRVQALNLQG